MNPKLKPQGFCAGMGEIIQLIEGIKKKYIQSNFTMYFLNVFVDKNYHIYHITIVTPVRKFDILKIFAQMKNYIFVGSQ